MTATWQKSSYSSPNGGECIEIADNIPGAIPLRDSKTPHGPALRLPPAAWTAFIGELKHKELTVS
ncbi:DUF397 domain-containing protein [Streptomyces sp. UNOC14_S4]|uniref:DUF397 domain-containing protein n=1 Tax=Streptomyces sp. UNOC14_S4 TaxID=2872340 RepID=UPI001E427A4F|nr:DUF397 domain-containing protein [Streptomyces sp. UNOC14_S4]MCC3768385.1 DUF397 domain-containing protein [Streptomyces sp. UNOC14_S4]